MKKLVYIHAKGEHWNRRMDYLLGTVQTVEAFGDYPPYKVRRKCENTLYWYLSTDCCSEATPNNPLSKLLYPNHVVCKNYPEYLVEVR